MQLLFLKVLLLSTLLNFNNAQTGLDAFVITYENQNYQRASNIFTFRPSSYTGSPWNLNMAQVTASPFQKSFAFWIRHNFTTTLSSDVLITKAASLPSSNPSTPLSAHFTLYYSSSGSNYVLKMRYYAQATLVATYTLTSLITLRAHTWYGVFISRQSASPENGVMMTYDPSNNYAVDVQSNSQWPSGLVATIATTNFFIDIGGDSNAGKACNCEVANYVFFYNAYYTSTISSMRELLKMPPKRDSTLEMIADYSGLGNSAYRGSSPYDTAKNTPLNFDSQPNGDRGHIYTLNSYDTIYPAIDLGREFAIGFWVQMNLKPSSVANDTYQVVFYKQNSFFWNMQVVVAFETTSTSVTKIMLRAGSAFTTVTLTTAITRGSGSWNYFYVSFSDLLKNETYSGTFTPTTLYNVLYVNPSYSHQSYSGTLAGKFIDGGSTDIMRIGMGEDGQAYSLYAVMKKFQLFYGAWQFRTGSNPCDAYVGPPVLIHMKFGVLQSQISCLTCQGTTRYPYKNYCYTTCPSQSYLVSDINYAHCEDCYYNCLTCTGRKGTQCSTCVIGNWDPFGATLNCPGANPCTDHQYYDGIACQECPNECLTCISATKCSGCTGGFSLNQNTRTCEIAVCGDGKISAGEQCDDSNQFSGDGCSVSCTVEQGFYCPSTGGSCYSICGDNILASDEECDDGNNIRNDGCSSLCKVEAGYFCSLPSAVGPFTGATFKMTCALCTNALCSVCATSSTCGKCVTGNYLYSGTCYASCSSVAATFPDVTAGVCQSCPEFCATCISSTNCTTCTAGNSILNNTCVNTCPDRMYSGLSGGVLTCLACPSSCLTCANSTYCYQCPSNSFLNIISHDQTACVSCDTTCRTCFGSTANQCVLCPSGKVLNTLDNSCHTLNCLSNQYEDLAVGICQNCDTTCKTCTNNSIYACTSCATNSALTTLGRCLSCTSTPGLYKDKDNKCAEICGDGKRIRDTTECDDGNNIDGDGCSSTCEIENGWECSGGDDNTADTCVSIEGPTPIVHLDDKNPTRVKISFSKKITNDISEKEIYQQIIVSLEGISSQDASYTIDYDSAGQVYYLDFDFKKSVVGAYININFADTSRISDGFSNQLTESKISLPFPSYYYVSVPVRETTRAFVYFNYACQGFSVFLSFSLFMQGKQNYFWTFMEFFQRVQYVTFINLKHPYFSEQFMESFFPLQLKWLPNIPKYLELEYDTATQVTKGGFYEQDKDAFYLFNIGTQITIWTFAIVIWMIARFIRLFINAFESYASKKIIIYFVRITEWSLLLRLILAMFFDLTVMTFLQLSKYNDSTQMMLASSILSIIGLIFILAFPVFIYFKVRRIANEGRLNTDTKFDVLHLDFKRTSKFSTKFLVMILVQKIIYALILVWLQDTPETQLGLLAFQQIIMIFFYLICRPFNDNSLNVKVIWQEFSLFGVFSLLFGVLDVNADDNIRTDAARVIVALLMMTLVMHTLSMFIHAIKGFRIGSEKEDAVLSKNRLINKRRREAKQKKYENLSGEHKRMLPDAGKRSHLDQTERHQLIDNNQSKDILTTNKNELSFV